eukprot:CFRG0500T1
MPLPTSEISNQASGLSRRYADVHHLVTHMRDHVQDFLQRNVGNLVNVVEMEVWMNDFWTYLEPYIRQASHMIDVLKRQTTLAIARSHETIIPEAIEFGETSSLDESEWEKVETADATASPIIASIKPDIVGEEIHQTPTSPAQRDEQPNLTYAGDEEVLEREDDMSSKEVTSASVEITNDPKTSAEATEPSVKTTDVALPDPKAEAEAALQQFYFRQMRQSPRPSKISNISSPPAKCKSRGRGQGGSIQLPEVPIKLTKRKQKEAIVLPDVPSTITGRRKR